MNDYVSQFINGNGKNRGRKPTERYASFDYCFNYFQQFRDAKTFGKMADDEHMEMSCLHLAFYLASWGMFRGSSFLLERSAKFFEPLITAISSMDENIWNVDADNYTDENIDLLIKCAGIISDKCGKSNGPTDTLITKIMLGVFGNVPAFDDYFRKGFGCHSFGKKNLKMIKGFYENHKGQIDAAVIFTFDFSGAETERCYTKAKIIDMIGFIKGQQIQKNRIQ
ncbi:MAG: hypothetical protein C4518_16135 [Desulfobacteraceae bacterium]|nr:MAG: hypothetical protein C4518_16135 [Desulfobacteraceae bacterium]